MRQCTSEWFHAILYCVKADGRLQEFEKRIIIDKFVNNKYPVIIVLTKSDTVSKKSLEELSRKIGLWLDMPSIPRVPICSVREMRQEGKIERSGIDELQEHLHAQVWQSIALRLPERCMKQLMKFLDDWEKSMKQYLKKNTESFNHDKIRSYVQHEINNISRGARRSDGWFSDTIKKEIEDALTAYSGIEMIMRRMQKNENKLWNNRSFNVETKESVLVPLLLSGLSGIGGFAASTILAPIAAPTMLLLPYAVYRYVQQKLTTRAFSSQVGEFVTKMKAELEGARSSIEESIQKAIEELSQGELKT